MTTVHPLAVGDVPQLRARAQALPRHAWNEARLSVEDLLRDIFDATIVIGVGRVTHGYRGYFIERGTTSAFVVVPGLTNWATNNPATARMDSIRSAQVLTWEHFGLVSIAAQVIDAAWDANTDAPRIAETWAAGVLVMWRNRSQRHGEPDWEAARMVAQFLTDGNLLRFVNALEQSPVRKDDDTHGAYESH